MSGDKTIPTSTDWRRQGQDKYLNGVELTLKKYTISRKGWDHDHCEFCSAKFSLNVLDLNEGFTTKDNYHWICRDCFNDFKVEFNWKVEKA